MKPEQITLVINKAQNVFTAKVAGVDAFTAGSTPPRSYRQIIVPET